MRGAAARLGISGPAFVQACAALGSLSAAAIHLSTATEHSGLYATGFVAMAAFQGGWAIVAAIRPTAAVMSIGIAGNAVIVAIWLVAHTAGLPFGPSAGASEATGLKDVAATGLELVVMAAALVLLRRRAVARLNALRVPTGAWGPAVIAMAALTSVALATPHAHRDGEHRPGSMAANHGGGGGGHPGDLALATAKLHHGGDRDGRPRHHRSRSRSHRTQHRTLAAHTAAGHVHLVAHSRHASGGHLLARHAGSGAHRRGASHSLGHGRRGGADSRHSDGHAGHHDHGGGSAKPEPPPPSSGGQPEGGSPPPGGLPGLTDLVPLPR
jgi:hypothetical protein